METINENIESKKTIHSDFYISNEMFQISKEKIFARSGKFYQTTINLN